MPSAGFTRSSYGEYDDTYQDESIGGDDEQLRTTRPTPSKKRCVTIYDENHYALARSCSETEVDDRKLKVEVKSVSCCTRLKSYIMKKKCYICTILWLLFTLVAVIGVLMGLTQAGIISFFGPEKPTSTETPGVIFRTTGIISATPKTVTMSETPHTGTMF